MPTMPENPYASPRGEADLPKATKNHPDSLRALIACGMLLMGLLTMAFATFGLIDARMLSAESLILGTVGLSSLGCGYWLLTARKRH